ncbi:MAG: hypothetical protein GY946_11635, partial [bacterium]|nr:hypothetical protein [bacterium]
TPFDPDGGPNLDPVPQFVDHLGKCSVKAIYYYHIQRLSGVDLDMLELLRCAERDLPNLAGIVTIQVPPHIFGISAN